MTKLHFVLTDMLNVIWMNRVQNESVVTECEELGLVWQCYPQFSQRQENGWLDLFQPPVYKSTGDSFLQVQSHLVTDKHFNQIAKVSNGGTTTVFLTEKQFAVTSILGWDENNGIVYFIATREAAPGTREFYSVKDEPGNEPVCITCSLIMPESGEKCEYNGISMSPDFLHYVHSCYGPAVPEVILRQTADNQAQFTLEANLELKEKLVPKAIPNRVYLTDENNGYRHEVRMVMPLNYNPALKYPAIVDVYGGPGYQEVDYRWSVSWPDYLTTNYDIIYISIDGRGSGYQSNE